MDFKIIETGKIVEIRIVNDDTGCDGFADMEIQFPLNHERDDDGNIICTQDEYDDLKEWWVNEVENWANGTTDNMDEIEPDDGWTVYTD